MKAFHIDLSHLQDTSRIHVKFCSHRFELQKHDAGTMAAARLAHPALAALPLETCVNRFTHFVDIPDDLFPAHGLSWLRIVRPQADPNIHVPDLLLMNLLVPESIRRLHGQKMLKSGILGCHPALTYYGLENPSAQALSLEAFIDAGNLVTAQSTASALAQYHPELSSIQPYTANIISTNHVSPPASRDPDQCNRMVALSNAIADPNNQPWAPVVPCTDLDGNPMTSDYDLLDENGKGFKAGQAIYRQDLQENISQLCTDVIVYAKRSAYDDPDLQNKTWLVNHGVTAHFTEQDQPAQTAEAAEAVTGDAYVWDINPHGLQYGLNIEADSISLDANDNLSINCLNWFIRTLTVFYQPLDALGKPIAEKPTDLNYIIPAATPIVGIPMPNLDQDPMKIPLNGSGQVNVYFGSLGTSNWDKDMSTPGALTTGIFQILIPGIFFLAAAPMVGTKFFDDALKDLKPVLVAVLRYIGSSTAGGTGIDSPFKIFKFFANQGFALLLQVGFKMLGEKVAAQVAAGELAESVAGPAGIAIRLAALVAAGAALAETTGEVLASPALITVKVSRTCGVTLTLTPDPAHGEAGHPETAVWPAVAQNYQVNLEYKDGGTVLVKSGAMRATTNGDPLAVAFEKVLAGPSAFFKIKAGLYSSTGWLCGYWESDWIAAVPNNGNSLGLGPHAITEVLVPLTQDSQYEFKEKIVFNGGSYVWQAGGTPPATTAASLDCSPNGKLCELLGITLSNSAFQVGYGWRAAGQNLPLDGPANPPSPQQEYALQNLSVLAQPGSRLKVGQLGFSQRPGIAYSPIDNGQNIDPLNFILDPRGGGMHLRQVTLDDGTGDFGLGKAGLQSWGRFPLDFVDAIAVHPSKAVVGISYEYHKLMILNLPAAPTSDDQAPEALMLSGKGVRQGLMRGPKAMAITADGRILVLEAIGQRIQAFDTKGSPVPCFGGTVSIATVATSDGGAAFAAELDAATLPDSLQAAFQDNGETWLTGLDQSLASNLDSGQFQPPDYPQDPVSKDPLIVQLSKQGIFLSYYPDQMNDPTVSSYITVNQAGKNWTITDPKQNLVYQAVNDGGLDVYAGINRYTINVIAKGQHWSLTNHYAARTYDIQRSQGDQSQFEVYSKSSHMPLEQSSGRPNPSYLDIAVEPKGFIYVLYHINSGSSPSDFYLELYAPDGSYLSTIPDPAKTSNPQNIVAGKIAVDKFRNLFSLNYEILAKPSGGPEPSLSHWEPTTPLFSIDDGAQAAKDFDSDNISVVIDDFATYGKIHLDLQGSSVTTLSTGYWQVQDSVNATSYHVVWSGDKLLVYGIPV